MADQMTGLLSPFLRSRRIAMTRDFLGQGKILDIGCGTGQLARLVDASRYTGVDQDEPSVAIARSLFPEHRFLTTAEFGSSSRDRAFDLIVGLAVIEHIENPTEWLAWLRTLLAPTGRVVLTTPHPSVRRVHEFGGRIGIFSREGAKEHRELLNWQRMTEIAENAGFGIALFRRFLLRANQLFVLAPKRMNHP